MGPEKSQSCARWVWILAVTLAFLPLVGGADTRMITLGSASAPADTGLLRHILPDFEQDTGIHVEVMAVGSGEALEMGVEGVVDVVLSQHPDAEQELMDRGIVLARVPVMRSDYVIVGPLEDPARVRDATSVNDVLQRIADNGSNFMSRGDTSGTYARERSLWHAAGLDPVADGARWYHATQRGMGDTVLGAATFGAYTLTDRGTWLRFGSGAGLRVWYAGDDADLVNVYSLVLLDPEEVAGIDADSARELADWLTSDTGRQAIDQYHVAGEQAFHAHTE